MPNNEPKSSVAKRVVKTVGEHVNVKKAARTLDKIVTEEAPRTEGTESGAARFVRGLGQRIGFAGIVAATVLAIGAGLAGCHETTGTPSPATAVATCEEDQPWCWDCHTMGNRQCGTDDGAVQR